uniref:Uncharacterized protein n=1 Tax=Rhizophora mucronata TaxID=61149 RepID=A0A2P2KAV2_RHIMU
MSMSKVHVMHVISNHVHFYFYFLRTISNHSCCCNLCQNRPFAITKQYS